MSYIELNAHSALREARRAEANALAYMIIALAALVLSVALVAWAIWA
ncbi:hypothetical protein [Sphingobium sp. CFD-2]|nr:hypothetical protein [Sphingobium sp. CFD-2]